MSYINLHARAGLLPLRFDSSGELVVKYTTPINYPGSKMRLSSWIVDYLPSQHSIYVEPFAGSASVFFNKEESEREVVNDINNDITHFMITVRDRHDELREWLEKTPYSRAYYHQLRDKWFEDGDRPDDDIRRAGEYFSLREMGYGGGIKPRGFARTSPHTGSGKVASFRRKIDERLEAAAERLRGVCIEDLDYRDCIDKYDYEDAVLYCDPPYYQHDIDYGVDFCHQEFADIMSSVSADVVISYDEIPPSFNVENGWIVVERDVARTQSKKSASGRECLLLNFEPDEVDESELNSSMSGQSTLTDAFGD